MELVKIQLQNQTTSKMIKGPIDCLQKLYMKGGITYLYKGLFSTTLRELSFGPYFLTYEFLTNNGQQSKKELTGLQVILAGGSAGIVAWCSTYFAG